MSQKSFSDSLRTLPIAHKVVAGCAVAVLAMGGFLFFEWVSTPSYAVLYTELDDQALSEVIDGLEAQGVPYQIESGGSTVMVPRQMVHSARANLASAGVSASVGPQGYELLDNAGLSVSDFRQQVDYKRALEGELAMTLMAMEAVSSADVLLVLPEEALFIEDQEPVTASVLVGTVRPLGVGDIEAITFLVAASVEGLEANAVALAHVNGQVLSAPGDAQGSMAVSNRNIRMVDDFERALATDVEALLDAMYGEGRTSVVVRADLNFDEQSVETQTFDAATSTPLREQLLEETLNGAGAPPIGTVGVNGEEIPVDGDGTYTYRRDESTTEYGIDRITTVSVTAPGTVNALSVAVAVDDGSITGLPAPDITQLEALVTAALGLNTTRGDQIQVSAMPFVEANTPTIAVAEPIEVAEATIMDQIPQFAGAIVVLVLSIAMLMMTRSGKRAEQKARKKALKAAKKAGDDAAVAALSGVVPMGIATTQMPSLDTPVSVQAGAPATGTATGGNELEAGVIQLAEQRPEEVAGLLRDWLNEGASV